MNILIVVLVLFLLVIGGALLYLVLRGGLGDSASKDQLSQLLQTQRNYISKNNVAEQESNLDKVILGGAKKKKKDVTSNLTLEKKLRYARWKLPPVGFYLISAVISLICVAFSIRFFGIPIIIFSLFVGPIVMGNLLNFFMNRRFNAFDKDYPAFLLNTVSMLRIGMNSLTAIQSSAESLNEDSLVREEVTLMLDRLQLGVSEDKSIGAFGEDINHPEIELFVQAVILSRRLGGNLSDTLDRLSTQVRKRQHFRKSAEAAVSLQKGSIWILMAIMGALELYILFTTPDLIMPSFSNEIGIMIWQAAFIMIVVGVLWIGAVTKIKV